MAEEYFHGEVCGAGNWWTSSTNTFGSSLCSSNINQTPNLGWPNHMIMDMNTRFNDDSSSPSDGSIVLQDAQQATGFEISSSTTPYNWNPDFLLDNLNSSMNYLQQTGIRELDSKNWIKDSSFYPSSLDYLPIKYQSPANNYLMKNPNEFSPSLPQIINPNKKPDITESHLIKEVDKETRRLSSAAKKTSSGQALKRPRIETPSPLPTFKVRKEKLGDRITVLQQLVSPFGKTDTASVLREAIEYIKFLHDQINALSTAYMKNGSSIEARSAAKQDLRSHGLCLVPLSSTFPVATETVNDFWTPTSSGGTFR